MSPSFWRGRRVFVTGHTGFKGAWLCAMLDQLGAEVTGYALDPPTEPSLFEQAGLGARLKDIRGDIRDPACLAKALLASQPEIVFHLAAQSLVRASYADPHGTYATNVMGTINLLEAARVCRPRVVVVATTDKCYENDGSGKAFREGDPLGGHDPYSSSKAAAEIAIASWRDSFLRGAGVVVASARSGNVIGGGDHAPDRIIPDAVRAFMREEPLAVRNPLAVRPWQHVLEPLAGYLSLAEIGASDPAYAGAWNFGPGAGNERTVEALIEEACCLWGGSASWRHDFDAHPHEAPVLRLDAREARERLGWTCRLGFRETIAWTMSFYRDVADGAHSAAFMAAQIESYLRRAAANSCASS